MPVTTPAEVAAASARNDELIDRVLIRRWLASGLAWLLIFPTLGVIVATKYLIVSAGTSDGPVVHEARIRADLLGTTVVVHEDVGVAGLHRLAPVLPDLERADCVVVVAGMDGALASVIGGLASCPVIGVPTSVGYGAARGGETALFAMLSSCADGLAVVGIDDGLGAGSVAARIARRSVAA